MPNFGDILNKKAEEIEKPPLPPKGTYRFTITKVPEATESNSGEWDILTFMVQALEPMDNVDMDEYNGDVSNIRLRKSFMFNKEDEASFAQTEYNLRTFLVNHLGLDENLTVSEMLNETKGAEFLGDVSWREDKRTEGEFQADIGRTAPVE